MHLLLQIVKTLVHRHRRISEHACYHGRWQQIWVFCLLRYTVGFLERHHAYEIGTDDQIVNVGNRSAFVRSIDGTGQFGAIMQKISADKFRGKRIRFSGFLRCKDAQDGCGLFMEVFALFPENNPLRAVDNMSKRLVSGTMEWVKCELTLDVPDDAQLVLQTGRMHKCMAFAKSM